MEDRDAVSLRFQEAAKAVPAGHARAERWHEAGAYFRERYNTTKFDPDLDEAVSFFRMAIAEGPNHSPSLLAHRGCLVQQYMNTNGSLESIDEVVTAFRLEIGAASDEHPIDRHTVDGLLNFLQARMRKRGELTDMLEILRLREQNTPTEDPFPEVISMFLCGPDALERNPRLSPSIQSLTDMTKNMSPDDANLGRVLRLLGSLLHVRHKASRSDLSNAIEYLDCAVPVTPAEGCRHSGLLTDLSLALVERADAEHKDLRRAFEIISRAGSVTPVLDKEIGRCWLLLGKRCIECYTANKSMEYIDTAVDSLSQAVQAVPPGLPMHIEASTELGIALFTRFAAKDAADPTQSADDLDRAFDVIQRGLVTTDPGVPGCSRAVGQLALLHQGRYLKSSDLSDLDTAIAIFTALGEGEPSIELYRTLMNLSGRKFLVTEDDDDLNRAIDAGTTALKTMAPHDGRGLITLRGLLHRRFQREEKLEDLELALVVAKRGLDLELPETPKHIDLLHHWSLLQRLHFQFTASESTEDLLSALKAAQSAVDATPLSSPNRLERLQNLEQCLEERSLRIASDSTGDLGRATKDLTRAVQNKSRQDFADLAGPLSSDGGDRVRDWYTGTLDDSGKDSIISDLSAEFRLFESIDPVSTKPSSLFGKTTIPTSTTLDPLKSCQTWAKGSVNEEDDDLISLATQDDDRESISELSPAVISRRHAATVELVQTFVQDQDLCVLYEFAFTNLDPRRFVDNHTKLLWEFVKDLKQQKATSHSQNEAIRFLTGRQTRAMISSRILDRFKSDDNADMDRLKLDAGDVSYIFDRFFGSTDPAQHPEQQEGREDCGIDDDSDTSETDDQNSQRVFEDTKVVFEEAKIFLCTGPAFLAYKTNLQDMLHPSDKTGDIPTSDLAEIELQKPSTSVLPPTLSAGEYSCTFSRPFMDLAQDSCKLWVETVAGAQLSWWPLSQPERELQRGFTRVYSKPAKSLPRFYDDLQTSLAESLFPELAKRRKSARHTTWSAPRHEAVHLEDMSLPNIVQNARNTQSQSLSTIPEETDHTPGPSGNGNGSQPRSEAAAHAAGRNDPQSARIVFLTAKIESRVATAVAVRLGQNDQETMHNLRTACLALPRSRWKRVDDMHFYQFSSFHMEADPKFRTVHLHDDRQRYPEMHHKEFENYKYTPSPWVEKTPPEPTPCLPGALWWYFHYPEKCGTSKSLNISLPVRCNDPDESDITAWGIHIEQHYPVFLILIPVLVACVITLAATFWFIHRWLETHPGDLQNATVPAFLAMGVVHFLVNTFVALLLFKWKR